MDGGIILDGRRIKAYEGFYALGEYAGRSSEWLDELWGLLVSNEELMTEFMYYLDNHALSDKYNCQGYTLTDLYVFQMSRYNLIRDIGKNTEACNKESMVLGAFMDMALMVKNPEKYIRRFSEDPGMDRLM